MPTLAELRRHALRRSLFRRTTLERAITKLGFVQADPIRAPARAQDLTLFQRVKHYRAGDLERRYERLAVEEDFFVNYGFLARSAHALMHPRSGFERHARARAKKAEEILAFVRERGAVHPRDVERALGSGSVRHWGGNSKLTTRLLDALHYRGFLRVVRRDTGIRVYAPSNASEPIERDDAATLDALVDVIVRKYAPLSASSLWQLIYRLRHAAPQWGSQLKSAFTRATLRLASAEVDGVTWFWPAEERLLVRATSDEPEVRVLGPFDPVVWDRRRFEQFWGWAYRFEAYTPVKRRVRGYYALPLLWGEHVIGWANLTHAKRLLTASFGYVSGKPPRDTRFKRGLEAELARFERFLLPREP
jgi:uncharacterized protein YcaQ